MADEFNTSGNWWEASRSRYESGMSPPSSSTLSSFGWQGDMGDIKAARSTSVGSISVSGTSSMFFQDTQKLQGSNSGGGGDPTLHMMGLGLSSQTIDWNQALIRGGEKAAESSFQSMLEDHNMNPRTNFQQTETGQVLQWRSERLFSGDSSTRDFALDQGHEFSPQYSSGDSTVTCQGLNSTTSTNFQMDSSPNNLYGNPSTILQGLADHHQNQQSSSASMNYQFSPHQFGVNSNEINLPSSNNWTSKLPQFLRTSSPPKQHNLPFNNHNASFWNNNASQAAMKDVRPSFFPSLQTQFHTPNFDEKPKINASEIRDSGTLMKKSGSETSSKRTRNETPSPLPAFKVRKEKMGDRITALQQLVSPFGKTDTASVLSEAIEYIKFLHEQVSVLSTPYMKSGVATQHQQNAEKAKDPDGPKQDLRSRGLCLVPVSSTFPVTHESTVDFWTPTFGGTFR